MTAAAPPSPTTLRATHWDGPAPHEGDLLVTRAGSWYRVVVAVAGAGVGHWRLEVLRLGKARPAEADDPELTVFAWMWARR